MIMARIMAWPGSWRGRMAGQRYRSHDGARRTFGEPGRVREAVGVPGKPPDDAQYTGDPAPDKSGASPTTMSGVSGTSAAQGLPCEGADTVFQLAKARGIFNPKLPCTHAGDACEPPPASSSPPNRSGRILSTLIASTRINNETATPPRPRSSSGVLAR